MATALRALPEVYRQVLTLHLEHGLNAKQIGEVLGRPAGTVRTQVVRGMDLLRGLLPAGFAAASGLVLSTARGLAAVRDAVLAQTALGSKQAVPLGVIGAGVIGGTFLMQKLVVGVAAVLAVAAGVWSWRVCTEDAASLTAAQAQPAAIMRAGSDATPATQPSPEPSLVRSPAASATVAAALASLRVRVQ